MVYFHCLCVCVGFDIWAYYSLKKNNKCQKKKSITSKFIFPDLVLTVSTTTIIVITVTPFPLWFCPAWSLLYVLQEDSSLAIHTGRIYNPRNWQLCMYAYVHVHRTNHIRCAKLQDVVVWVTFSKQCYTNTYLIINHYIAPGMLMFQDNVK